MYELWKKTYYNSWIDSIDNCYKYIYKGDTCVLVPCSTTGAINKADCEKACCKATYNCVNNTCVKAQCDKEGRYNSISKCQQLCGNIKGVNIVRFFENYGELGGIFCSLPTHQGLESSGYTNIIDAFCMNYKTCWWAYNNKGS